MDWHKLKGPMVRGRAGNPVIIALHGFGQRTHPRPIWHPCRWAGFDYLDFAAMSGILDECRVREWSCWMPQAPWRNWTPAASENPDEMFDAALEATCSQSHLSNPFVLGFSDGATLANRLIFAGVECPGIVSYEGMMPELTLAEPKCDSLIVCGVGADRGPIRRSIIKNSLATYEVLAGIESQDLVPKVDLMTAHNDRHEWHIEANRKIFPWIATKWKEYP